VRDRKTDTCHRPGMVPKKEELWPDTQKTEMVLEGTGK